MTKLGIWTTILTGIGGLASVLALITEAKDEKGKEEATRDLMNELLDERFGPKETESN